jgi:hypothetical protein
LDLEPNPLIQLISFVIFFPLLTVVVWATGKICEKAGFSWAWGLLAFIPFVNLIVLLKLAFTEWPIERDVRSLRAQQSGRQA